MESIEQAICWQADFRLLTSATSALGKLQASILAVEDATPEQVRLLRALTNLVRVAHQRRGFLAKHPSPIIKEHEQEARWRQRRRQELEERTPEERARDEEAWRILTSPPAVIAMPPTRLGGRTSEP